MITEAAVDNLIKRGDLQGILDQDGWETLELTVYDCYAKPVATQIIDRMMETQKQ